ncbi:MAG: class I SAM-dependent methyltransferase [Acidobacteria bacterium]|nr:class I SAM-dependent methyltransferase [Acidobacteriota bacterium]
MSFQHIEVTPPLLDYIRSVSAPEPEFLQRLREETASDPLARMQITVEQGALMGMLVRISGARRALEIGVFTGYSSISVALALPSDGSLIACDVSEHWTSVARRYWKEAGVENKITLHLRPALETLDELIGKGQAGSFDFAFIDADKVNYDHYYERALILLRQGGLMAIDNVLWHGRVIDPSVQDEDTVALRALNAKLHNDPRVHVCMLPMGDGITLACKV